jgi:hypothetical protein
MGTLNVAVITLLGQTPVVPLGAEEITVGGATVGLVALSGSLQAVLNASNKSAMNQIVELLTLLMTFITVSSRLNCRCTVDSFTM